MNPDDPRPVECGKCLPSKVSGMRARFTDTQAGRRAHLKVFGHTPTHVPPQHPDDTPSHA